MYGTTAYKRSVYANYMEAV